jgi:KDO2-lipid IV(A) lauroyltransferase
MSEKQGNKVDLNLFQSLGVELLWYFSRALSISPRWFRFGLFQPFITILLRIIGYRSRVIIQNLEGAFPEKSKSEIRKIKNRYYSTLSEVIIDTMCLAGADSSCRSRYMVWEDVDKHVENLAGRDWVAMGSHFGCWEYLSTWAWEVESDRFMAVYHPLTSKVFEVYYRRIRNFSPNLDQVTMAAAVRHYITHRSSEFGTCIGLISDQSPALTADTEWIDFLGRPTAFVDGAERLAIKFKLPVYFGYIRRIRAGQYSVRMEQIYDGVESVERNEITRRYAKYLEQMIRETPELWMWSHRRWKHTPEKQAQIFGKSTIKL